MNVDISHLADENNGEPEYEKIKIPDNLLLMNKYDELEQSKIKKFLYYSQGYEFKISLYTDRNTCNNMELFTILSIIYSRLALMERLTYFADELQKAKSGHHSIPWCNKGIDAAVEELDKQYKRFTSYLTKEVNKAERS